MPAEPRKSPSKASKADRRKATRTTKEKVLKPWDQRPWPKRGDRSARTLYAAVGGALSAWEICDWAFGIVFQRLVAPDEKDSKAAMHAYTSIRTFEGRLALVRASGRAYFFDSKETPTAKQFWKVCGEALSYAGRRNEIAHGMVNVFLPEKFGGEEFDRKAKKDLEYYKKYGKHRPAEWCLYPSYSAGDKYSFWGLPLYAYTSKEIKHYTKCFLELSKEISGLCKPLQEDYEQRRRWLASRSPS